MTVNTLLAIALNKLLAITATVCAISPLLRHFEEREKSYGEREIHLPKQTPNKKQLPNNNQSPNEQIALSQRRLMKKRKLTKLLPMTLNAEAISLLLRHCEAREKTCCEIKVHLPKQSPNEQIALSLKRFM